MKDNQQFLGTLGRDTPTICLFLVASIITFGHPVVYVEFVVSFCFQLLQHDQSEKRFCLSFFMAVYPSAVPLDRLQGTNESMDQTNMDLERHRIPFWECGVNLRSEDKGREPQPGCTVRPFSSLSAPLQHSCVQAFSQRSRQMRFQGKSS